MGASVLDRHADRYRQRVLFRIIMVKLPIKIPTGAFYNYLLRNRFRSALELIDLLNIAKGKVQKKYFLNSLFTAFIIFDLLCAAPEPPSDFGSGATQKIRAPTPQH